MPRIKLRETPEVDMTVQTGLRDIRIPKGKNEWVKVSDVEARRCRKNPAFIVEDDETEEKKPRKAGRGE